MTRSSRRPRRAPAGARRGVTDRLLGLARGVARAGVWFGGALIILAAFLIGVEVVIRKAFDRSIGGADELSGYALAIGSAWAFGFTLLERAHVRIDSLYVLLPARLRVALDLVGLVAFTGLMALVTWHAGGVLRQSAELGARSMSPLATPLVLPQTLWVVGLVAVVLTGLLLLVRAVAAGVAGDRASLQRLIGSRTLGEEIEAELQAEQEAAARRAGGVAG